MPGSLLMCLFFPHAPHSFTWTATLFVVAYHINSSACFWAYWILCQLPKLLPIFPAWPPVWSLAWYSAWLSACCLGFCSCLALSCKSGLVSCRETVWRNLHLISIIDLDCHFYLGLGIWLFMYEETVSFLFCQGFWRVFWFVCVRLSVSVWLT